MEWTLPHAHSDNRGVRRYFSLASSPTEETPKLLVKFYDPPSSYKRAMQNMKPKSQIIASQLSGDFTLPKDITKPLVLVAGGVGVAPFRSMVKYIVDKKISVNIVHLFINKTSQDVIYKELFAEGEKYGVHTVYFVTSEQGHLTPESIQSLIPDFKKRKFYISGPQLMVQSIEQTLLQSGASSSQLKTDFFPGYFEKTT
jgi:ferredoxin-NADP reductase